MVVTDAESRGVDGSHTRCLAPTLKGEPVASRGAGFSRLHRSASGCAASASRRAASASGRFSSAFVGRTAPSTTIERVGRDI